MKLCHLTGDVDALVRGQIVRLVRFYNVLDLLDSLFVNFVIYKKRCTAVHLFLY